MSIQHDISVVLIIQAIRTKCANYKGHNYVHALSHEDSDDNLNLSLISEIVLRVMIMSIFITSHI